MKGRIVGRADAAARGADLRAGIGILAERVEIAMQGKDERAIVGDAQIVAADRDALRGEPLDLRHQRMRIDHDAVADHRQLARPHDARGQ